MKSLMPNLSEFRIFQTSSGKWHACQLMPLSTSNPSPTNAFWQQVTKDYIYHGNCIRALKSLLRRRPNQLYKPAVA